MKFTFDDRLSEEQLVEIDVKRREILHKRMRNDVPEWGKVVNYLGRNFLVYPTVFWPHADSQPLVKNYVIKPYETVLDVGTGSGNIAIESALRGAHKVVALDVNPEAVKSVRMNAQIHGVEDKVTACIVVPELEDSLERNTHVAEVAHNGGFDVITGNLPFLDMHARDHVESSTYDEGLRTYRGLFGSTPRILRPGGRIYLSQANFGNVEQVLEIADDAGFGAELIGRARDERFDERVYYAFEFRRK
ncbi:MAG: 50S ribosomal protein L11 methyltransferase [archaeon]